ncbi:LPS export ABC transporter periplasmic protein LptC [uncultured Ferrovibrio sp.]|jgi:lipopolysaccharide export system protein LptC|uniref:LPS export ABC transporter periplasmic protein LptC n=1 Tax=uncultured Ferrovibrio sp. TaxID=1576913 RepID=UPI0026078491|nr:LPS export ABC transporter periplasmic protein LptC [uncultured Ferrovibrio sp.]
MASGFDETSRDMPLPPRRADKIVPRDSSEAIGKLSRRRRFARFMKFVLPLMALGTVAVVIAWPQLTKRHQVMSLTFNDVDSVNAALVMNNPRYRGTDSKDQPYVVTADRAVQDPEDSQQVTLDNVQADITSGGGWWSLMADTGLYHGGRQLLHLFGNVTVIGDNGYEMHGNSAEVNLETNVVISDEKVWGQSETGTIRANGLRIYDKGRVIVFVNGVNTTLYPRKERG